MDNLSTLMAVLSASAALLTSAVSLFTLKEMNKQRKNTYKPEIVLTSESEKGNFINFKVVEEFGQDSENDFYNFQDKELKIEFFNLGKGSAKDLKLNFIYDINTLIERIKIENLDIQYDKQRSLLIYKNGGQASVLKADINSIQNIDYILPFENGPNKTFFKIPNTFLFLNYLELVARFESRNEGLDSTAVKTNEIEVEISYSDIAGEKHINKFEGKFELSSMMVHKDPQKIELIGLMRFKYK